MSTFAELAWIQFWQISVVALVAGGLAAIACRRRPHLAYLLWLVVITKCLTPPVWSSPTGLFSWALTTRTAAGALNSPATRAAHDPRLAADAVSTAAAPTTERLVSPQQSDPTGPSAWPAALTAVAALWLAGALAFGVGLAINLRRVTARLERTALPLEAAWLDQLNACACRLGLRRRVRLLVTSEPIGPAVYGLFRPVIVLPACVACRPPASLAPILSHELVHIRRGDPIVAALQAVAQCLWWFHPIVWWANRQANRERERACDEEVLAELKVDPADYGQCLLDIVRLKQKLRPVLAFPGVRAVEVTTRRLRHIMEPDGTFQSRTPRRYWALALLAAASALPGAGLAFDSNPQSNATPRPNAEASRTAEADANATSGEPNFIVIPIRTKLQRELVANGKPVQAVVELNGYALNGKRGDDLMRAIDASSLRKSLAAIKASDANASIVFVLGYFGEVSQATFQSAQNDSKSLEQVCRSLAKEARLQVTQVYSSNDSSPDRWKETVHAVGDFDFGKGSADESPVGDRDVSAFPVRTRVTQLLTASFSNFRFQVADCVVYVHRPLQASDHPMISPDLEAHIKQAVSTLDLPRKVRIDYHLIPAGHGQAYLRNNQAIMDRFYPNEAPQLTKQLGFKNYSATY